MKAAIYCRLSKEDEELEKDGSGRESESIQNQKSMLIHYAVEKGYDIYQIYCDEDYSGIDRARPAFNRMIEAAGQHKFDVILAKTQSRFTRDMELVEKYLHGKFIEWGVRFIAIVDHVDTADEANKKAARSMALSMSGIWRICPITSVPYCPTNAGKENLSVLPLCMGIRKTRRTRTIW